MPGLPLSALIIGLAAFCHAACVEPDEERDAVWQGVLGSLGGNTAE